MENRFSEQLFKDTVLYCRTAAGKVKFGHVSGMKEFPGRFTDSLIVVCAHRFSMQQATVRESLKALIRRKRDAIKNAEKQTATEKNIDEVVSVTLQSLTSSCTAFANL